MHGTATETITDEQITSLRTEAYDAGDEEQVSICDLALGKAPMRMSLRVSQMSAKTARKACVEAINSARAMED